MAEAAKTIDRAAIFGKIAAAQATGGGNFIKDGKYVLAIWFLDVSAKQQGATHIGELDVLEAESIGEKDEKGNPVVPNKVGTRVSWVQLLEKHKSALGNVKAFYLALDGTSESDMPAEQLMAVIDEATSKGQTFRGMKVRCETYRKLTKDGKTLLTLPRWSFIEQSPEQVAEQRRIMESAETKKPAAPADSAAK